MKRDDCQSAAGGQPGGDSLEGYPEAFELFVHGDAECLKGACRGMDAWRWILARDRGRDDPRKIAGGTDRLFFTDGRNATGNPSRKPLFAKLLDHVGEGLGPEAIHKSPGRFPFGGIKSQVERAIRLK